MQQIAAGQRGGSPGPAGTAAQVRVEAPSSRFATFRHRQDYFEIDHPDNWESYQSDDGFGVTIVPRGGVVEATNGQQSIVYGAIVNHYDPFEAGAGRAVTLDSATTDLVNQIRGTNSYLRTNGRARREVVDGMNGRSVVLSGRSPVTGAEERVTVFTRETGDGHVIYAVFIAPGRDYAALGATFTRMIRSLRVNDQAAHRVGAR
jgi:hypothetical protein